MSNNAVIYPRVSTEEQAEHGVSLRAQEELCRAFADRNGWPVVAVCRDEGVSGGKPLAERPGLNEALSHLKPGDFLVVLKRDRLFRADALYQRCRSARAMAVGVAGGGGRYTGPVGPVHRVGGRRRIVNPPGLSAKACPTPQDDRSRPPKR